MTAGVCIRCRIEGLCVISSATRTRASDRVLGISSTTCTRMPNWILDALPMSRTLHVLQDGAVWRSHPLDLSETDQWEAICSEHVISFELLETRLADSCHQRRIYDVINHHSPCRRSCFRDRTKRMLRCVFARSFRERKLEFLSAQTRVSGSFARKLPCFVCAKLSKQTKGTSGPCLGLTSMAVRPGDTPKLPSRPPWGPPTRARDCRWLASVCVSEAALRAIGAGAGKVLRGSPDVPKCGQVAPTAVGRRCAAGLGRARPGARRRRAPGIVVNYSKTRGSALYKWLTN